MANLAMTDEELRHVMPQTHAQISATTQNYSLNLATKMKAVDEQGWLYLGRCLAKGDDTPPPTHPHSSPQQSVTSSYMKAVLSEWVLGLFLLLLTG